MLVVEAMAAELRRHGVAHVFAIPGKESLRLCIELERAGIALHAARHETQAVMMADGFYRASGRLGVALLAQGAGFGNGVGGMACAVKARSGVVIITGDLLRSDGEADPKARAIQNLKGIDQRVVCEGIGIRCVRPRSAATFVDEFVAALIAAQQGCALLFDVPSDLFAARVPDARVTERPATARREPMQPAADDVEAAAELLATGWAAARPVIIAGRGAVRSGALPALLRLGETTGALLGTTLMARSAFRGDPYDIGVCGTFSTAVAGALVSEADCIVAFGASLNPFTTYGGTLFPRKAHVIQIDDDASALGKYLEPELGVRADARWFAERLEAALAQRRHRALGYRTADVAAQIAAYDPRAEFRDRSGDGYIDPRTLMVELDEALPRNRVLVIDGGAHLHYACTYLQVERPEDFVFPLDSLAIGLGMGAAIGAALARPGRTTVLEIGDCGFMMGLGDLETAVRLRLPLVVIVSNDQAWGAEAQHLQLLGLPDDLARIGTPMLAAVATAMGADGYTIASRADLQSLAPALRQPRERPLVVDCRVDPRIKPESFNFDYAGVFAK